MAHFKNKYGLLSDTLLKNLKEWNVPSNHASLSRNRGISNKLTTEQEKEVCRLYIEEKLSTWKIAPKFNVLNVCILQILRRNNIPRRTRSVAARLYTLDESYFENINTPAKAYFLGLIYAEGHVESEGRNTLVLALQEEDKYILDFLNNELNSNRPLGFMKKQKLHHKNVYVLKASSLKYVKDLQKLGIEMGKKSHKITFPDFLNENLYPYFILAYFEGDGCTYVSKSLHDIKVSFAGNKFFIEKMGKYITDKLNIRTIVYHRDEINAVLEGISGYNSIKFLNWVYCQPNLPIYMKRKFNKYKQFILNRLNFYKNRNIKSQNLINNKKILEKSLLIIQSIESKQPQETKPPLLAAESVVDSLP